MMAILVWWFALPSLARRLIGAFLLLAIIAGSVLGFGYHEFKRGYRWGADVVRDSVWNVEIARRRARRDSLETVAVTSHQAAVDSSAAVEHARIAFVAKPQGVRLEPLPDTFSTIPRPDMVRVTVESTGEVFDVPRGAAQYWKTADSLVSVASALLEKYARANAQWASAWEAEHNARLSADSLTAAYAERLRATELVPPSHMHRIAYLALGAAVALIARNQFHR